MKMYVGVTDYEWFSFLKEQECDEVNFWKPGGKGNFKVLGENEMFLFKLHAPQNYIVGGGFFVRFSILPVYLAWDAFEIKNGVESREKLEASIRKYKLRNNMDMSNPMIGCIILTDPFFFEREDWIPVPEDWNRSIVQGKSYDTNTVIGGKLYLDVIERMPRAVTSTDIVSEQDEKDRYSIGTVKHRLGQGAFRVAVTDAYQRRCAISGEKTLPVLEAAHIIPYASGGEHLVTNGLLLRSDIHTLFDSGYVTIDKELRIYVSDHLHDDYGNGKDYYKYKGKYLSVKPEHVLEMPSKEFLQWHNENVYRG